MQLKMRSMTLCWVLFVRFHQSLFFLIMSYLIKQKKLLKYEFLRGSVFNSSLENIKGIFFLLLNSWKRRCFGFQ
uniref:Transmembrane protein n=1 Tax=Medicago truncatula TaxID=3880 RepID=B7FK09_MEDTR|nr:unknown [Medicago truncatula]